jgi:HlyD family secretion protein
MGRPAISIIDTSRFRVPIEVDELDVGRLKEGQSAQVRLDALPGEDVAGTVRRIAPAAMVSSGVVSYDVIVDLAPTDVPMRVDMTANVTVVVEELTDVLVIPTWVVRVDRRTNQTYVDKQVAEGFQRVDVELGVRREGLAEVISGLSEGDVVVRAPDSGAFSFELGQ